MPRNRKEINAEELFELLSSISKFIEKRVRMYALGGTALTILNIKASTRDIDLNIESKKEYDYICRIFEDIGFEKSGTYRWITQEGLAFDLFWGSDIMGTSLLPDCLSQAKYIGSFGRIELYTLSLYDIIISKLARGDPRDFDDIKSIFENKRVSLEKLTERYKKTMEMSVVAHYRQKLLDLIEIKFKEWKFDLDKRLIEKVKKWQER